MKIPSFLGGTDEQKSNNLSDDKCVNLYPVTNNNGSVTGFYKVDGLKVEGTLSGVPTGAYKASNGRAFYTSGTTLYELTVPAGVYTSTSRGTVTTSTNYDFSDNGIEMIMVNGVDGWLFTFADNSLKKLTVITGEFTLPTATQADVDAVFTKTAHGLSIGERIILSSTGALPDNLKTGILYYVLADGFTADTFKVGLTLTGLTCTISNGANCTVTATNHGFLVGDKVRFLTTGTLPSPLVVGTIYYVIPLLFTNNSFVISATKGGSGITTTTAGSGIHSFNPAVTIIQKNTKQVAFSTFWAAAAGVCTISIETTNPSIITKTNHGLVAGDRFVLSTTGVLPSHNYNYWALYYKEITGPLPVNTDLYVLATDLTSSTFKFAFTPGGYAIGCTAAGSGVHSIAIPVARATTIKEHDLNVGDAIQLQTTNSLPSALAPYTTYYVTGEVNIKFLYQEGAPVYGYPAELMVVANKLFTNNTPVKFFTNGTLPKGLELDTRYYLRRETNLGGGIAARPDVPTGFFAYKISEVLDGEAIIAGDHLIGDATLLEANVFSLTLNSSDIYGQRIQPYGTQNGDHTYIKYPTDIAYGVHTFNTESQGFPNGTKQVKYMNGRFIAYEPNTQNFYVSEVLEGKYWNAINVQTVDSNPDYITGIEVSHNELIVFCENSGETFYDSGTTPSPFVRNLTGIFDVGTTSPYSIAKIDNTIYWMGNTTNGNGIIYRLSGLTPERISTYSIEYAIQQMTTISDARAFTYQKDGHHYYVITFPTGNKTFVYDLNTQLWHERAYATYAPSPTPPSMSWVPTTSAITGWNVTGIAWNGSVYCAVGTAAGSSTTKCYTSTDGINWTERVIQSAVWQCIAWNGVTFAALSTSTQAATSPDGITWTSRVNINSNGGALAVNGTRFVSVSAGNAGSSYSTDNGVTWSVGGATPSGEIWKSLAFNGSLFCVVATNSTGANAWATSPDGVIWTARTPIYIGPWQAIAWNGTVFCAVVANSTQSATSLDGITWTSRTLPAAYAWSNIKAAGSLFCLSNTTNNNTYISIDGITWTASAISGGVGQFNRLGTDGTKFVTIGLTSPFISALSSVPVITAGTYTLSSWPANKYLYYNKKHLITDTTTSLQSIDSSTYKNGASSVIRYVRSFRSPESEMKYVRHNLLELEAETGVGATTTDVISMRWSNDNGNTWSTPITKELGTAGDYARLIRWHRIGKTKGYARIYEISGTSDTKIALLAAYLS